MITVQIKTTVQIHSTTDATQTPLTSVKYSEDVNLDDAIILMTNMYQGVKDSYNVPIESDFKGDYVGSFCVNMGLFWVFYHFCIDSKVNREKTGRL